MAGDALVEGDGRHAAVGDSLTEGLQQVGHGKNLRCRSFYSGAGDSFIGPRGYGVAGARAARLSTGSAGGAGATANSQPAASTTVATSSNNCSREARKPGKLRLRK